MANRDVLAIGTSAGGVEALLFLARHLPRDFPAAVLVTLAQAAPVGTYLADGFGRGLDLDQCRDAWPAAQVSDARRPSPTRSALPALPQADGLRALGAEGRRLARTAHLSVHALPRDRDGGRRAAFVARPIA